MQHCQNLTSARGALLPVLRSAVCHGFQRRHVWVHVHVHVQRGLPSQRGQASFHQEIKLKGPMTSPIARPFLDGSNASDTYMCVGQTSDTVCLNPRVATATAHNEVQNESVN